jgi:hypothetical protein
MVQGKVDKYNLFTNREWKVGILNIPNWHTIPTMAMSVNLEDKIWSSNSCFKLLMLTPRAERLIALWIPKFREEWD